MRGSPWPGAEPVGPGALDAAVRSALSDALASGPPPTALPAAPDPADLRPDAFLELARAAERGARGDQASIETLGRGFSRRDPLAGRDPLPRGRDAVTYSTAAVSTSHEAGQHWPELVAFRASDRFPAADGRAASGPPGNGTGVDHVPTWLAGRAGDLPAAAVWPGPPPGGDRWRWRPQLPDPGAGGGPGGVSPAADRPAWLRPPEPGAERAPVRGLGRDLRADFPALAQRVNGQRLVWLDNGATTHKPQAVIDAIAQFYARDNSNVHRGSHTLAGRATDAYESAREKVRRYLGASSPDECVFVRGTTEAINLVAETWGARNVGPGDEILVTHLEHHANLVPWQHLAESRGARLRAVPVDDRGDVRMDAFAEMLSPRVRLVAVPQVSNALGTVVPVSAMAALAHEHGAIVLVDGAQSAAHLPIDVSALGADFFAFSGHKVYGPTGIGVLWGRRELWAAMPPWQRGGSMIRDVTFERTVYADPPAKFEAGTPNLAGAVGLGAALDYVEALGRPRIAAWEHQLLEHLLTELRTVPGLRVIGDPVARAGAVSFVLAGREPSVVAAHLDRHGIALRAGHHCAQPILRRFGLEATVRPSLGLYNGHDDIEHLGAALRSMP